MTETSQQTSINNHSYFVSRSLIICTYFGVSSNIHKNVVHQESSIQVAVF